MTHPGSPVRRVLVPDLPPATPLRPPAGSVRALAGPTMGTTWSVRLVAPDPFDEGAVLRRVESRLARVIAAASTWEPESAIARFNAGPAGSRHVLPEDLRRILRAGLRIAAATGGAFDPTIGPAVDLWGFGPAGGAGGVPDDAAIAAARARIGFGRLRLDADGTALQPGGLGLDLSGIAKGFAVDAVAEDLAAAGFGHGLVEIGGECRGWGTKPDGRPWWIALEAPPGGEAGPETVVALHGLALATSGDYRRCFEADGRVLAHTLDPRTGAPLRNGVASVSVVAATALEADGWATALTVLGPAAGLAVADREGIAACWLVRGAAGGFAETASAAFAALAA